MCLNDYINIIIILQRWKKLRKNLVQRNLMHHFKDFNDKGLTGLANLGNNVLQIVLFSVYLILMN